MANKNKLYIGNLSFDCTNEDLMDLFKQAGEVEEAAVVTDRFTGRSRGFGFVTMIADEGAAQAIELFNNQEFLGRPLVVREAYDAAEKKDFGGRSRGGQGGGGGGQRRPFNRDRERRPSSSGRGGRDSHGRGGHSRGHGGHRDEE
ncbi:MAG: RNA-binding protein [Verrucomicrobia bacterium]|nr:MAG: RNA-binding protein [Verrucomicrobiota bacterium]